MKKHTQYISEPVNFLHNETNANLSIERNISEQDSMLKNLVELIVFTPIGNFNADPDFGLEYWSQEYVNISESQFNNNYGRDEDFSRLSTKDRCEKSIAENFIEYAPEALKMRNVHVVVSLKDINGNERSRRKVYSHHEVVIFVSAEIDDGMGTTRSFEHQVSFMVEPTVKKTKDI
jgi:hypothetical protein